MHVEVIVVFLAVITAAVEGHAREGTCPPPSAEAGICIFDPEKNCLDDHDCNMGLICCSDGCNSVCKHPIMPSLNGTCPDAPDSVGICVFEPGTNCLYDTECSPIEKCCPNGCNSICKQVIPALHAAATVQATTGLAVIGSAFLSTIILG